MPEPTSSRCIRSASLRERLARQRLEQTDPRELGHGCGNVARRHAEYGTPVGILAGWRYCPRCASELAVREARVECEKCGFVHYAKSAPAVSALVVDDAGRMLLARRAHDPDAGLWDTLGGFLDEGEHPLDGLRRELRRGDRPRGRAGRVPRRPTWTRTETIPRRRACSTSSGRRASCRAIRLQRTTSRSFAGFRETRPRHPKSARSAGSQSSCTPRNQAKLSPDEGEACLAPTPTKPNRVVAASAGRRAIHSPVGLEQRCLDPAQREGGLVGGNRRFPPRRNTEGPDAGPSVRGGEGEASKRLATFFLPGYASRRKSGRDIYAARPSVRSSADFGCAPTAAAAGAPSLNRIIVGIDMTP